MIPPQRLVVQRVHNNNVVLALDGRGRSLVVTGPGVGFGLRRGSQVDVSRVEAVYVPEDAARAASAAGTLADIPREVVTTAREIVDDAQQITGLTRPEILLLPVADHLQYAIRRAQQGTEISLPLVWEVRHLYPRELAAGDRALAIVRARLGTELPADEATAFALHFVSATFSGAALDRTVSMTEALSTTFDLLDERLSAPLDRNSQSVARFVTHLRYLFVRLAEGRDVTVVPGLMNDALESSVPETMRLAREVAQALNTTWGHEISEDETIYIALHIHRLVTSAEDP